VCVLRSSAQALDPQHAKAQYRNALCQKKLGMQMEAITSFRAVFNSGCTPKTAAACAKEIRALESAQRALVKTKDKSTRFFSSAC